MNKSITEYLNLVCAKIKSRQARLAARAELMGHIQASVEDLKRAGFDGDEAVKTALERMGDPSDIGAKMASFNAPWKYLFTTAAGAAMLAAIFIWLGVFRRVYLFDPSALLFVILLTLAFVLIGGLSRLTKLSAVARGRTAALYAGGIGMVIGVVDVLGNIGDLASFAVALSFCVTSILYGLLASALLTSIGHFFRPLEPNEIRRILGWEDFEL